MLALPCRSRQARATAERPSRADCTRLLLGSGEPDLSASIHCAVVDTAAKFDCSSTISAVCRDCAEIVPASLARLQIEKAGPNPEVVLEATYGWYWAVDALEAAGATVHLAHPLGVKVFRYRRVKNDVRDAGDLADLLRMNRLPEAWIAPATGA